MFPDQLPRTCREPALVAPVFCIDGSAGRAYVHPGDAAGHRPGRFGELRGIRTTCPVCGVASGRGGLAERAAGRAWILGRDPISRLRRRQPGLRAVLVRPQGCIHLGLSARGPGPAAADDAQHGSPFAHPLPAAGQQGVHAPDGRPPRGTDPSDGRRDHRRGDRGGRRGFRDRCGGGAPADRHFGAARGPSSRPSPRLRLVQPDDRR